MNMSVFLIDAFTGGYSESVHKELWKAIRETFAQHDSLILYLDHIFALCPLNKNRRSRRDDNLYTFSIML